MSETEGPTDEKVTPIFDWNGMRARIDREAAEFLEKYGFSPTKIWTPLYPADCPSGEAGIGCTIRKAVPPETKPEIFMPMMKVYPFRKEHR